METEARARIIGAGLAGSEAAWQIASRGFPVEVFEMRPERSTDAHTSGLCAELVCSNSFRGAALENAVGLLKEELRLGNSLIMQAAEFAKVPAGGALAVDRDRFSSFVDRAIREHPLIALRSACIESIPDDVSRKSPLLVATGPLTDSALAQSLQEFLGSGELAFYDAISPIVTLESLDTSKMYRCSRYQKGSGDDYLNIPLSEEQYEQFIQDVAAAEKHFDHGENSKDESLRPFEGCMPIEDMVERGPKTLRFGPLKPVGLEHPETGKRAFAVLQLRQDNKEGTLWSMVGIQTNMKHGEQLRIFRSLPGMEKAEFIRLGSVHRNTFINSPALLSASLECRELPGLFFAGQVTGTEGYVESTAGGLLAGLSMSRCLSDCNPIAAPNDTAHGGLAHYISEPGRKDFQPMNISFGLIPSYFENGSVPGKKGKKERRLATAERALHSFKSFLQENSSNALKESSSLSL